MNGEEAGKDGGERSAESSRIAFPSWGQMVFGGERVPAASGPSQLRLDLAQYPKRADHYLNMARHRRAEAQDSSHKQGHRTTSGVDSPNDAYVRRGVIVKARVIDRGSVSEWVGK